MSDHFLLEPEHFKRYATLIGELGEKLKDSELMLTSSLHHEGECWGGDDPGKAFAGAYGPKGDTAFTNAHSVATHLNNLHAVLVESAKRAENQEQGNADANRNAGR
ncbi:hypothetical protein [Gordonia rhizosphera]|uniref:ESAT-6-like protein n=1 Tax=Gordonia rhizosphera NBRC 16068 TaxID=1108045 RepID=K6WEP9_9ACTN|nr:hypothetical protein [Gordonia rhizosphera]GAB92221.1 hypothetical protein GORHZ_168_00180 [Gordonia rhizosphera NBRC 16068]